MGRTLKLMLFLAFVGGFVTSQSKQLITARRINLEKRIEATQSTIKSLEEIYKSVKTQEAKKEIEELHITYIKRYNDLLEQLDKAKGKKGTFLQYIDAIIHPKSVYDGMKTRGFIVDIAEIPTAKTGYGAIAGALTGLGLSAYLGIRKRFKKQSIRK